ncbi:inositol monophosphatase family protein [Candidatus Viridilinea mediisalina]|uniref:Histidinol phosphate phosphatase n=1 Tax=Candidatus Viridilinea mediisalina TaxID=2024553 RepID=A0A2A6RK87_9CHLR|nr:inositol monophosphatase family protein [Candidatus Viridilinea mediisalina]PDW03524.1 histidinol phosphate phosphatase [Candidatus Viridilinea mediisalina]
MTTELSSLLAFTHQLAWQAGKITLRYFQSDLAIEHKADASPVTIADREAEAFLRAALQERYPDHAILGEEEGLSGGAGATYRWILDPIDGTKTFVRGMPLYGVMIGLLREGQPILGVVNMPALNEIVYAAQGLGCWWNGRPCRVSPVTSLNTSLVVATIAHGYERYNRADAFQRIIATCGLFRTWGDCYGHLLVATGRAEVALDPIMSVWDAAALLPILSEAGGTFTDWQGNATIENEEGMSTNGLVFDEVLRCINR